MALVVIGASSFGFISPLVKLAFADGWGEMDVSVSQVTMGAVLLWVLLAVSPKAWGNPFRSWKTGLLLAGIGILGFATTTLLYNGALGELDASIAVVLLFQFAWLTIVWDSLAARRWPSRNQLLAVGIVVAGTLCAVDVFSADFSQFSLRGLALGLGSAVTYSLYLYWTGSAGTKLHPLLRSVVMLTAALPVVYAVNPPTALWQTGSGGLLLWGLLLGLLGQAMPMICFNAAIPRIGGTLSAMLGSIELPVAVIAALLILGESVAPVQWGGMALILAGIVLAERDRG